MSDKTYQRDLVKRLERSDIDAGHYSALQNCRSKECGRATKCSEICIYGNSRRAINHARAIKRLFSKDSTVWEVRLSRSVWSKSFGKLPEVSISAALQLNRRAFDKLFSPVVAVGMFKVYPTLPDGPWRCEIHELVASASQADLEAALNPARQYPGPEAYVSVRRVKNLNEAIKRVVKQEIVDWHHPEDLGPVNRPGKRLRSEFYAWGLRLDLGQRLVRYGCDRYFNKLDKKPRKIKLPKKRPYPFQLVPFMFGNHPRACRCQACGYPPKAS